jgi:hypothetical protein
MNGKFVTFTFKEQEKFVKNGKDLQDTSAHVASRALVSQLASETWSIKHSVISRVKQTPFTLIETKTKGSFSVKY